MSLNCKCWYTTWLLLWRTNYRDYTIAKVTQNKVLRIPDSYHAKTLKKHTPLVRFALYFYNQAIFQKSERSFFDQVAIDGKSALTFENRRLVAELKFKT